MKLKIYVEETYTTTIIREAFEIDSENYPKLSGMSEEQISNYIDDNIWEMKPINGDYSSLGEELSQATPINDDISNHETNFYVAEL
jgi:hypothetical protein